ncbi:MAG: hypothetical protein DCC75_00540 [Proteobacteria bacterium]|nr:MAG: hypothetical protein DCC75_00540 [Pseudomonadota bacterium]
MQVEKPEIRFVDQRGQGRAFVIIRESGSDHSAAHEAFNAISEQAKVFLVECSLVTDDNWQILTSLLLEGLRNQSLRQASFLGFGPACSLIQNLALRELKLVRTLIFVDALTRPHPGRLTRFLDRIESWLPLGLPLRSDFMGFDSKPFLQRLRCPCLVVTSFHAGELHRVGAQRMLQMLPTAWGTELSAGQESEAKQLARLVLEFYAIPARCPQKSAA